MPKSCGSCSNSFCSGLSEKSRQNLFEARVWVSYKKKVGQMFFLENKQLLIIERGAIACTRNSLNDRQQNVDLLGPGDLLGCVNLFQKSEREMFHIYPLLDSYGCMLPISAMERLAMENPEIGRALIAHLTSRYSRLVDGMLNRTTGNSQDRLNYMLDILSGLGVRSGDISHEVLAMLTGLSRVTVTKTIHLLGRD